jgi:ABC-type glutathione transport system ATPase component
MHFDITRLYRTWARGPFPSQGRGIDPGTPLVVDVRPEILAERYFEARFELQGLSRRYGDVVALDDLSFTVREGQMFGFVGPNGAGKTTAMRIVLGVLEPDRGEVRWRGRPVDAETRRRFGYMPEDHGQTFSTSFAYLTASSRLIAVTGGGDRW